MTDEYRQVIREKIAAGMASLRAGRGTDGEAVFARIYAEMDELERQQGRDRRVFKTEDLSAAELKAIADGEMDARHDHLNTELE